MWLQENQIHDHHVITMIRTRCDSHQEVRGGPHPISSPAELEQDPVCLLHILSIHPLSSIYLLYSASDVIGQLS